MTGLVTQDVETLARALCVRAGTCQPHRQQAQALIDSGVVTPRADEPRLGLATTEELIQELAARAEVSRIAGDTWPSYRTVDSK